MKGRPRIEPATLSAIDHDSLLWHQARPDRCLEIARLNKKKRNHSCRGFQTTMYDCGSWCYAFGV